MSRQSGNRLILICQNTETLIHDRQQADRVGISTVLMYNRTSYELETDIDISDRTAYIFKRVRGNRMLENENAFYATHRAEFQEKYLNKWLVIVGEALFGVYDTPKEAVTAITGKFKPGEFLIHSPANDGVVIEAGTTVRIRRPGDDKTKKVQREIVYA